MEFLRTFLGLCVYTVTILVVVFLATAFWMKQAFVKPGPLLQTITVDIPKGSGVGAIASELTRQGAISHYWVFMVGARVTGQQTNLKAGEYEIVPGMSTENILDLLASGKTVQRRVTVREGLTSYEIVQILNSVADLSGEITAVPTEGTLLPNTWDYRRGEDRNAVIVRMQDAMTKTITELWAGRAPDLPFSTPQEAMILASIVEKETGKIGEHARVAGVFINRLRQKMPLQTDPTVIYALTMGQHKNDGMGPLGRRLLSKDLSYDSPYNTYLYAGLPPAPIANPGRGAIEATLNPEKHDYLFFVADGTGGHVFARTLAEHNKNVAQWRKIRKEQSGK